MAETSHVPEPPIRVAIVDDDLWIRDGRAAALRTRPLFEVVMAGSHADALAAGDAWADVDVALVDAWDRRAGFDRFPGVAVVSAIRAFGHPDTRIVVITGHVLNDALRLRMAEAGADYFYGHEDVADLDALADVIRRPSPARRPSLDAGELAALGVRRGSRPNDALGWVHDAGYGGVFSGEAQKSLGVGRRSLMRIRAEVGDRAQLTNPVGRGNRAARWPEWQEIVRFVNRMRGADTDDRRGDTA